MTSPSDRTPATVISKNRFTQEFEEWNEITGALPKGIGWYYECQSIFEDADKEIQRLTRERDQWQERHNRERAAHAANLTQQRKVEAERDRLRAALEESVALQSHYATLLNGYDGGERLTFASADAWIERLVKVGKLPGEHPNENQAGAAPLRTQSHYAPTPRGSLPNSLGNPPEAKLCEDCLPVGYPDNTRCLSCPRRGTW